MVRDRIGYYHKMMGRPPTPEQQSLYDAVPTKRGFAWPRGYTEKQRNELFEAVLLFALAQTAQENGDAKPHSVYLFVPSGVEEWATQQIRRVASDLFGFCKKHQHVKLARHLGDQFKAILLGSRLTLATPKPDRWAVYGFEADEDLPKWLVEGLVPVYPFNRDDEESHA